MNRAGPAGWRRERSVVGQGRRGPAGTTWRRRVEAFSVARRRHPVLWQPGHSSAGSPAAAGQGRGQAHAWCINPPPTVKGVDGGVGGSDGGERVHLAAQRHLRIEGSGRSGVGGRRGGSDLNPNRRPRSTPGCGPSAAKASQPPALGPAQPLDAHAPPRPAPRAWSWLPGSMRVGCCQPASACTTSFSGSTGSAPRVCQKSPASPAVPGGSRARRGGSAQRPAGAGQSGTRMLDISCASPPTTLPRTQEQDARAARRRLLLHPLQHLQAHAPRAQADVQVAERQPVLRAGAGRRQVRLHPVALRRRPARSPFLVQQAVHQQHRRQAVSSATPEGRACTCGRASGAQRGPRGTCFCRSTAGAAPTAAASSASSGGVAGEEEDLRLPRPAAAAAVAGSAPPSPPPPPPPSREPPSQGRHRSDEDVPGSHRSRRSSMGEAGGWRPESWAC